MRSFEMGAVFPPARHEPTASNADGPRVVFLTDIITPYFAPVLEALADRADLTVVFCSRTGTRGMNWNIELSFRHEVIEGLTIRRRAGATDFYLSPRIATALRRARPDAIISSGFSLPTLYASFYARARRIPLIIQSDGTSRSEAQLGVEQRLARRALIPHGAPDALCLRDSTTERDPALDAGGPRLTRLRPNR